MSSIIKKINNLLLNKEISCKELTEKYFSEIKKSKLNSYVRLCEYEAFKVAETVDKKINSGKQISLLEGIPMTLKDNISTKNIETTCCSRILKGYIPTYDAFVWEILKNENAILLGKSNSDEFAMGSTCETSCYGPTFNPYDLRRTPGGSSGGTAAAVAGNLATYGLGSDTGGSVRQPSGLCGVVGLKSTYGSISRYGLIPLASSFDQVGPIAQTVEDCAIIFKHISKYDSRDETCDNENLKFKLKNLNNDIKNRKIGVPKEYFENLDPEIFNSIKNSIEIYKSLGAEVEYFSIPEVKYAVPIYYILCCAEASSNLGRFDGIRYGSKTENYKNVEELIKKTRSKGFGKEVRRRILLGTYVLSAGFYDSYYGKAQLLREKIRLSFKKAFEKYDILLTPTFPSTAFKLDMEFDDPVQTYLLDICTVLANVVGVPAISVPCGYDSKNLPIGIQLTGNYFQEEKLFNIAYKLEEVLKCFNFDKITSGVRF
ncbi:MAG: Asp-tRNA(Asn)/Glu-tRNA(Gln) amidotransferase subunit GatA [Candidatus Paraimprobicoccus trichonymphae]|uniref:Glutamyl-tRNA(Gln) amidotransferase subunit A n=1 Tax=Candidatus Paraimprobicoccus trichonymphae TaxID=3033793 RepID=A0AA48L1C2_9FIRM|nr:MAG: Asp-tRNA(Asn)/Glu-tRNA(Gln) amidotransferase subunit GatA [Candidatus Paraimprobicoccus trichonymphae]